jgi:hypothetical protein
MKSKKPVGENVIHFKKYHKKREEERKQTVLKLEVYKHKGKLDYSYTMKKGPKKKSDAFIAFALAYAIEDIVMFNNDPCDILELTEEIIIRLGFEPRSEEDESE